MLNSYVQNLKIHNLCVRCFLETTTRNFKADSIILKQKIPKTQTQIKINNMTNNSKLNTIGIQYQIFNNNEFMIPYFYCTILQN